MALEGVFFGAVLAVAPVAFLPVVAAGGVVLVPVDGRGVLVEVGGVSGLPSWSPGLLPNLPSLALGCSSSRHIAFAGVGRGGWSPGRGASRTKSGWRSPGVGV